MIGVYRRFGDNTKVGPGYNVTGFSGDIASMSHDNQGRFHPAEQRS